MEEGEVESPGGYFEKERICEFYLEWQVIF